MLMPADLRKSQDRAEERDPPSLTAIQGVFRSAKNN